MNTGNICYDYLYDLIEVKYITKERAIAITKWTTNVVEKVLLHLSISRSPSANVINRCVPVANVEFRNVNIVTIPATTLLIP